MKPLRALSEGLERPNDRGTVFVVINSTGNDGHPSGSIYTNVIESLM